MADPLTISLIAGTALSAAGAGFSAFQSTKTSNFMPEMPNVPALPNFPEKPDLAGGERSSELARRAERRRRASTLLTGIGGSMPSQANVTRSLLGQ